MVLHRRFGPLLQEWYGALAALEPTRVQWTFPEDMPMATGADRYDVGLFDQWMRSLPRTGRSLNEGNPRNAQTSAAPTGPPAAPCAPPVKTCSVPNYSADP